MSLLRHNPRRDANEKPIVDALRQMGASVVRLDKPVDLVCGYRGATHLVEVKTHNGKLTAPQAKFIDEWRGSEVTILRSVEDALAFINNLKTGASR